MPRARDSSLMSRVAQITWYKTIVDGDSGFSDNTWANLEPRQYQLAELVLGHLVMIRLISHAEYWKTHPWIPPIFVESSSKIGEVTGPISRHVRVFRLEHGHLHTFFLIVFNGLLDQLVRMELSLDYSTTGPNILVFLHDTYPFQSLSSSPSSIAFDSFPPPRFYRGTE